MQSAGPTTTKDWMATLALVNATAGGIVLVLPIIGMFTGYLLIPLVVFMASICCYYTAVVMFRHLGSSATINECIYRHFGSQRFCEFYNLVMFLSFFGEMLLYYDLLVAELAGICFFLPDYVKTMIPLGVAVFLLILGIVARIFHFEDELLGYGILSMIAFCFFIVWIIIDRQPGPKQVPIARGTFISLAAAMSQGYSIHNMMIPVILRAQNPQNYKKILANVFLVAGLLYTFIAYGCFAIVNRKPITGEGETVQDYFSGDEWEIFILRGIYIVNIITVFPGFMSISRIRFFNMFTQEQDRNGPIKAKQIFYYIVVLVVCFICKLLKLKAKTIIQLNGSIICLLEIYVIPMGIHLKCIWWDYNQEHEHHPHSHQDDNLQASRQHHKHPVRHQQVKKRKSSTSMASSRQGVKRIAYQLPYSGQNGSPLPYFFQKEKSSKFSFKQNRIVPVQRKQPYQNRDFILQESRSDGGASHSQQGYSDYSSQFPIHFDAIFNDQSEVSSCYSYEECPCHQEVSKGNKRFIEIGITLFILAWGFFVLVYTLHNVIYEDQNQDQT